MERNPGLTIPRYNDVILLVPWYIVISGFHCTRVLSYILVRKLVGRAVVQLFH